jgi:hypothetical protein
LSSFFHADHQPFRRSDSLTFGDFIDGITEIAKKYGCRVHPAKEYTRMIPITGENAYEMALFWINDGRSPIRNIKSLTQVIQPVLDIIALIEQWGDFDHAQGDLFGDYQEWYLMNAKMSFRSEYDDLDQFSDKKAIARLERVEGSLRETFARVPGAFGSSLLEYAILLEADTHGSKQAQRLNELAESVSGPGVSR